MNKIEQKPVTEEVKEWSVGFMKTVETEGYENVVKKLNELTPEIKVGVLEFLKTVTDYCVKNDLRDFLDGVDNYKKLISTKEIKINRFWRPRSIYRGKKIGYVMKKCFKIKKEFLSLKYWWGNTCRIYVL